MTEPFLRCKSGTVELSPKFEEPSSTQPISDQWQQETVVWRVCVQNKKAV